MEKVKVVYGSTTGCTEAAARQIAASFGVEPVNVAAASAADFCAGLLILGSSTWGVGELQDDWAANVSLLDNADLAGVKVAVFGLGDQCGFGDTFCDAMALLARKAVERGAVLTGQTPVDGYISAASMAVREGKFCGLALDDCNEPEKTAGRIAAWVAALKAGQEQFLP